VELLVKSGAFKDISSANNGLNTSMTEPEHFDFSKANKLHQDSIANSPKQEKKDPLKRKPLPWGGIAAPEMMMDIASQAGVCVYVSLYL
jgi:hypothetical protein